MSAPAEQRLYSILAYGIETKGLPTPKHKIEAGKYTIEFGQLKSAARFQDFDGVILFQGTFESFERVSDPFQSFLKHDWDPDELDRRTKEALTLVEDGRIVCMLLTDPFIDFDEHRDFRNTDLSKRLLLGLDRRDFQTRSTIVESRVNELLKFFKVYGAACVSLAASYGDTTTKTLASSGGRSVSVLRFGSVFAIPTLIPRPTEDAVTEYFTILADGIVSLWEHLREELPTWASEYQFPDEAALLADKTTLSLQITEIERNLQRFDRLKRVLVLQGEPLVEAVMEVFEAAFPLKPKREETFREDLMLIDPSGQTVALVEVKGVSRGVAREHVNQADNHRERNGMSPEFPSLLIINTNIKNSMTLADKDQAVAAEQIQHAARNNVLVLRTLDLLNLAALHLSKKLSSEVVVELLTRSRGWLRVNDEAAELLSN